LLAPYNCLHKDLCSCCLHKDPFFAKRLDADVKSVAAIAINFGNESLPAATIQLELAQIFGHASNDNDIGLPLTAERDIWGKKDVHAAADAAAAAAVAEWSVGELAPRSSYFALLSRGKRTSVIKTDDIGSAICEPSPCKNGGICLDQIGPKRCPTGYCDPSTSCVCNGTFFGPHCEHTCTPNPCKNGGSCFAIVSAPCVCKAAYTGTFCATRIAGCIDGVCGLVIDGIPLTWTSLVLIFVYGSVSFMLLVAQKKWPRSTAVSRIASLGFFGMVVTFCSYCLHVTTGAALWKWLIVLSMLFLGVIAQIYASDHMKLRRADRSSLRLFTQIILCVVCWLSAFAGGIVIARQANMSYGTIAWISGALAVVVLLAICKEGCEKKKSKGWQEDLLDRSVARAAASRRRETMADVRNIAVYTSYK